MTPIISARAETLRKLWSDGLSAKEIAGKLGGGVTAAGVDVEARKLGLPARRGHWDSRLAKIRFKIDGDAPKPEEQGDLDMPTRIEPIWRPPHQSRAEPATDRAAPAAPDLPPLDQEGEKPAIQRRNRRR